MRGGNNVFWEERLTDFIKALLASAAPALTGGDPFFERPWFFDVGANIGAHTVGVGAAGWGVIAIEANPATAARLQCSIQANALAPRVALLNAAMTAKGAGERMCVFSPEKVNLGFTFVRGGACSEGQASVATLTLDALFAAVPNALPAPTVMKIDIEGSELLALRDGGSAWLATARPQFVLIEVQHEHLSRMGCRFGDLIAFWLARGYHGWVPRGNTRQPGPEIALTDFDTEEKAAAFIKRLAGCNYDVFFTLAAAFPINLPARVCSNSR